jgi:hypothetical protein
MDVPCSQHSGLCCFLDHDSLRVFAHYQEKLSQISIALSAMLLQTTLPNIAYHQVARGVMGNLHHCGHPPPVAFPGCDQALQTSLQAVRWEKNGQPEPRGVCPIDRERCPRKHDHSPMQCLLRKIADISLWQVHLADNRGTRSTASPQVYDGE